MATPFGRQCVTGIIRVVIIIVVKVVVFLCNSVRRDGLAHVTPIRTLLEAIL